MLISITKNEQHQTDTTNSLAHQHPRWNRVLTKKLAGPQLVKFPIPILHQINPVHASPSHVLKIHFNIILPPMPRFPSGLLPLGLPTKTWNAFLLSLIHTTQPAHLTLLNFITRILRGKEYRSKSSSLCSLLHYPITSSLSCPVPFLCKLGGVIYCLKLPNILHFALYVDTVQLSEFNKSVSTPKVMQP